MLKPFFAAVVVLAASLQLPAQDQAPTTAQPVQYNGAVAPVDDDQRAPVPAFLTGEASSLQFNSELERSNYVRGGISVGATYDDNAANTATNPIGDLGYSILPNIALDQNRSRSHWTIAYMGGFITNQRLSARNQGSHNLSGMFDYRLSPHVTLHLSDAFYATTGFLQQLQGDSRTPVTGPINQPNPTIITPLAKSISNTGSANISYQFSADNMIGGGGTFYDTHYRDVPNGAAALLDTTSRAGDVYYNHRFTARNWTGLTYRFQQLSFSPGSERTRTHSFLLSHTIYLQSRMTLSLFAGPEYSEIDSETVTVLVVPPVISLVSISNSEHHWSGSGGVSFGWQGDRTSTRLDFTRRVADGGGIASAVQFNGFNGAFRRQLIAFTAVEFKGFYGHNRALQSLGTAQIPLNSASGGVGLEQRLTQNLMLRFEYDRDYQDGLGTQTGNINHNRGSISIGYNFTRPIGR